MILGSISDFMVVVLRSRSDVDLVWSDVDLVISYANLVRSDVCRSGDSQEIIEVVE